MNSDKIRDRINAIGAFESDKDKVIGCLELYKDFLALLSRNKVSSPAAAAVTCSEIEAVWRPIVERGVSDTVVVEVERGEKKEEAPKS